MLYSYTGDMTTEYNGWVNWPTWNIVLWLQNTEHHYRVIEDGIKEKKISDPKVLADYIRNYVFDNTTSWAEFYPKKQISIYFGDVDATLYPLVNWEDVAGSFLPE